MHAAPARSSELAAQESAGHLGGLHVVVHGQHWHPLPGRRPAACQPGCAAINADHWARVCGRAPRRGARLRARLGVRVRQPQQLVAVVVHQHHARLLGRLHKVRPLAHRLRQVPARRLFVALRSPRWACKHSACLLPTAAAQQSRMAAGGTPQRHQDTVRGHTKPLIEGKSGHHRPAMHIAWPMTSKDEPACRQHLQVCLQMLSAGFDM